MSGNGARISIDAEFLRQCFTLDTESGRLYWKERPLEHFLTARGARYTNRDYVGRPADEDVFIRGGYRRVRLLMGQQKKGLLAHRVVFAIANGYWPTMTVDHINGDRTDNRPANLEEVSQGENMRRAYARRRSLGLPIGPGSRAKISSPPASEQALAGAGTETSPAVFLSGD